jgi:hypothetical protein
MRWASRGCRRAAAWVEAGQLGVQRRPAVAGGGVLDLAAQDGSASGSSDRPSRSAL